MSDSDIVELCQQIYRTHKNAIDLIIEHMPDLRRELADYLADLVRSQPDLALIRDTKSYVDFVLREWQDIPELNLGNGWPGSSSNLAIQFSNSQNQLNLYLVVGPVEDQHQYVREAIYQCAYNNRDVFTDCRPILSKKWTYLYKLPLLRKQNYEDASVDDLAQIIEPKWERFLQSVLPQLHDQLMRIRFS